MPEPEADNRTAEQTLADAAALLNGAEQTVAEVKKETTEGVPIEEVVTEPIIPEKPEGEEISEEELPHGEKSRLGRKVKRLEDTLSEIKSSLQILTERGVKAMDQVKDEDPEPELSEYPTAKEIKDREAWFRRQITKQVSAMPNKDAEARKQYQTEYGKLLEATVDPEEDAEIDALLKDTKDLTYNTAHTGDPKIDFLKNYSAASKAVLGKSRQPKVKVLGKKAATELAATGNATVVKTFDRNSVLGKLSKDERSVAEHLDDNELKKMFG